MIVILMWFFIMIINVEFNMDILDILLLGIFLGKLCIKCIKYW